MFPQLCTCWRWVSAYLLSRMASVRGVLVLLVCCLAIAGIHRFVPFPVPGVQPAQDVHMVSRMPVVRPSALPAYPGQARGGADVAQQPQPYGPPPTPVPAPTAVPTPTAPPGSSTDVTTTPQQSTPDNPLGWFFSFITGQSQPDSSTVAKGLLAIIIAICNQIFGSALTGLLLSFGAQSSFLWVTPPEMTYNHPTLVSLHSSMVTIAAGLFLIVFMWNGIQLMWRRSTLDYAAALETIPRAILAFFLAAFSGHFMQLLIDLNNALCTSIEKPDLFQVLNTTNADFLFVLTLVVYGVMGLLLFISSLLRVALLIVEFVIGPLACVCLGTKETEAIGKLWLHVTVATVAIQFLQVLVLSLGLKYLAPAVTGVLPNQNLVSILVSIAMLYLTLHIPKWFQQAALASMRDAGHSVTSIVGGLARTTFTLGRALAA